MTEERQKLRYWHLASAFEGNVADNDFNQKNKDSKYFKLWEINRLQEEAHAIRKRNYAFHINDNSIGTKITSLAYSEDNQFMYSVDSGERGVISQTVLPQPKNFLAKEVMRGSSNVRKIVLSEDFCKEKFFDVKVWGQKIYLLSQNDRDLWLSVFSMDPKGLREQLAFKCILNEYLPGENAEAMCIEVVESPSGDILIFLLGDTEGPIALKLKLRSLVRVRLPNCIHLNRWTHKVKNRIIVDPFCCQAYMVCFDDEQEVSLRKCVFKAENYLIEKVLAFVAMRCDLIDCFGDASEPSVESHGYLEFYYILNHLGELYGICSDGPNKFILFQNPLPNKLDSVNRLALLPRIGLACGVASVEWVLFMLPDFADCVSGQSATRIKRQSKFHVEEYMS